ncbi:MAG: ketoacyl-ACP synthase III [Ekhidna sp.]|nr:ketoacyl-ACP synthase III [Ekhidna sp.]
MRNAKITSTGMYVPERIVPNTYFDELLGEKVSDWLEANVHIKNRRWCAADESTVDLCENAAKVALDRAELDVKDIDLLIVATDTPEYISPSTASKLQYRMQMTNAATFDLNSACAGFVIGLDTAAKYIKADENYNNVLLIGAYAMSKYLNMKDKKTCNLFADGAGAVVLSMTDDMETGFQASEQRTKGEYCDWMGIYAGGTHQPVTAEVVENKDHLLKFVKRFPTELNPSMWSDMAKVLAKRSGIAIEEVDQFLFTQININSIWATLDLLGLPREKAHTVMHEYGYTGSACIPMALDEAIALGKIKRGDKLFFIGSGGGLAFASAAFKY